MNIKRYTIASFILMIFIGWFVHSYISQDIRTIHFFGIDLPAMPVALWIVTPLLLMYFASLLHMGSCSITKMLELRRYRKDFEELTEAIRDALLGKKNRRTSYKTERYSILGNIIDKCDITPTKKLKGSENPVIQSALTLIDDIENGEVVDLRKFHIDNDNPLAIKYNTKRYEGGHISAEDILSKPERFSEELAYRAYKDFVLTGSLALITKYKQYMSKEALVTILGRVNAREHTLKIDNDTLFDLIQKVDATEDEYICGSIILAKSMMPEQRIALFERLSNVNDDATAAYIYTLYDLEVVEQANDLLDTLRENEYPQFRAYRALRETNKNFSINLFTPRVCR
jgi:hypothetical protein